MKKWLVGFAALALWCLPAGKAQAFLCGHHCGHFCHVEKTICVYRPQCKCEKVQCNIPHLTFRCETCPVKCRKLVPCHTEKKVYTNHVVRVPKEVECEVTRWKLVPHKVNGHCGCCITICKLQCYKEKVKCTTYECRCEKKECTVKHCRLVCQEHTVNVKRLVPQIQCCPITLHKKTIVWVACPVTIRVPVWNHCGGGCGDQHHGRPGAPAPAPSGPKS